MPGPKTVDPNSGPLPYFASELRRLREVQGWSQKHLAEKAHITQGAVSEYETGKRAPLRQTLDLIDHALSANGQLSKLWTLISGAGPPDWFRPWLQVELEATSLSMWEPLLFPGILQVEGYARKILEGEPGATETQITERLNSRLERKELLNRDSPPMLWVVLDQVVLDRPIGGPAVMRAQLDHLLKVEELPHITIQVVPYEAESTSGLLGAFQIAHSDSGPTTVYLESAGSPQVINQPDMVTALVTRFGSIRADANNRNASRRLIEEARGKWQN